MGNHDVQNEIDLGKLQTFTKALLEDLRALAFMLENGHVESNVRRIGAEQEMFIVDREMRPSPLAIEVLKRAKDPRLTTEIAKFNLEANLTPLELRGDCFKQLERELSELLEIARNSAAFSGSDILLSGILPTLEQSDLSLANLTPAPRYSALNRNVINLRGGPFSIHIKGLDEISLYHDNIMMESCNTSFQVHFQTSPAEFVNHYNTAQAITGPVLSAAVNSPILFGHRLWQETRVALFQHSTDERSRSRVARSQPTRVSFGEHWLEHSIVELFHEQICRFRPIMINEPDDDPFAKIARGEMPQLSALRLHNGTVWRWNRACYGITEGVPHLRIENRALPSGPTVVDEIANAAFFTGLMVGLPEEYGTISERLRFEDAKVNFFAAARHGLDAHFNWIDGTNYSASRLLLEHLIPLARAGLRHASVDDADIDNYLGVIETRVKSRQTGAQWTMRAWDSLGAPASKATRRSMLASAMCTNQKLGLPVHTWPKIAAPALEDWSQSYRTVGQFMTTDLFTMQPDDLIDLAASVMHWRHIRHVPVEDDDGHLVGLITHRQLIRLLTEGKNKTADITVREIMLKNPITVTPLTTSLEAIEIMRTKKIGCLPVTDDDRLVGIVTSFDFLQASAALFAEHMKPASEPGMVRAQRARG
ncbi:MAG TPA: CBS domain-containing protein [Pyrinomonadaceae bacterium]|nr:CBS domain-containing protein [Pyrinomonadaceae bacterium]